MMNEHAPNDPELKSLEARLAAMTPQLSPTEQQQLLYECGVAAGRAAGRTSVRRWQGLAAMLCITVVAMSFLPSRNDVPVAEHRSRSLGPTEVTQPKGINEMEIPAAAREQGTVALDAWQTTLPEPSALSHELAWRADPHLSSLTVGALTRSLLSPSSNEVAAQND
jgi:hypothetical protein